MTKKEIDAKYYNSHKKEVKERIKVYYLTHKEQIAKRKANWYQKRKYKKCNLITHRTPAYEYDY